MGITNDSFLEVQKIRELADFVNFVQNPDKFAEIVNKAIKTLEDAEKVVNAFTSVEQANAYLKNSKESALKKELELKQKEKVFEDFCAGKAKEFVDVRNKLDEEQSKLQDRQTSLLEEIAALNDSIKKNKERAESVASKEIALNNKETQLNEKETDLNEKAAKIKALLG